MAVRMAPKCQVHALLEGLEPGQSRLKHLYPILGLGGALQELEDRMKFSADLLDRVLLLGTSQSDWNQEEEEK